MRRNVEASDSAGRKTGDAQRWYPLSVRCPTGVPRPFGPAKGDTTGGACQHPPCQTDTRTTQSKNSPINSPSSAGDLEPKRELDEKTQKLVELWKQSLRSPPPTKVFEGATYEEGSTAFAWTMYRIRQGNCSGPPVKNAGGYFVRMLRACRAGEKHLGPFEDAHIRQMLEEKASPDMFFA